MTLNLINLRSVLVAAILGGFVISGTLRAQQPNAATRQPGYHPLIPASLPLGATSSVRLLRGGCISGYFQPVQFTGEEGLGISVATLGAFADPLPTETRFGLLIGPVYRFRITNIPGYEGREVFPTVELVDRLYPPAGGEMRFPVPIELTSEDLRLALEGHFITRVVYLEDPNRALPTAADPKHPSWFDAGPGVHPLVEVERVGRPIAILRMGGRLPDDRNGPDLAFLNGCPPLKIFHPGQLPAVEAVPTPVPAVERIPETTEVQSLDLNQPATREPAIIAPGTETPASDGVQP
jgi:hypothetical protein